MGANTTRAYGASIAQSDVTPKTIDEADAMLAQIVKDVQRGIAMTAHDHGTDLSVQAVQRCVARAMPAAVDMTLRGYPNAAVEIGQNEASVEIATARNDITNGGEA